MTATPTTIRVSDRVVGCLDGGLALPGDLYTGISLNGY
jgi:hypothetical protein